MTDKISIKARRKPIQHERAFQINTVNFIHAVFPDVIVAAVANGGSRNKLEAANLKRMGVLPGFPDLVLYWTGGYGVIELKAGRGKLSDVQQGVIEALRLRGVKTAICRNLEEIDKTLREWGCRSRGSFNGVRS